MGSACLDQALAHAPRVIAVDGGADAVLAAGLVPEHVIGDLDSVSAAGRRAFADRLQHVAEQDSTDFGKALRLHPAPLTIAVGFIGARVDHFLSCLTELARSGAACILLGEEDCVCIAPRIVELDLAAGVRVSLWPLTPVTGRSNGLRWPLDGVPLSTVTRAGTSNEATGPVRLDLDGTCALILPAQNLPEMIALMTAPPRGAAESAV